MFSRLTNRPVYSSLQSEGEGSDSVSDLSEKSQMEPSRLPFLLVALCATCTITNVLLFLLVPIPYSRSDKLSLTHDEIHKLQRPSQYIRLDEIERPTPPVPLRFDNYPIVVAPIDSERQYKVFPDDPRRYMAHAGTISSEGRRVLVTSTVSTIVQFRAIDYGMEICELHVDLPPQSPNSTTVRGHNVMLSLYRLDATVPLNTKTLSYKNRPKRLFKIDDISLGENEFMRWHRRFSCKSEEVLSFELSRPDFDSGYDCHIEWWQNQEDGQGKPAIYITQHATV